MADTPSRLQTTHLGMTWERVARVHMQRRSSKPGSRERMRPRTSLSGGKPGQQGRSKCRYRGCQFTYVRPSIGRHSSSSEDNYDASDEVEEAHGKKGLTRCREQKPRYGGRGGTIRPRAATPTIRRATKMKSTCFASSSKSTTAASAGNAWSAAWA